MLTVTIEQSEGISGADIPEQAVTKMRTGSAALSLSSPRAFFAFLITERLSTTISESGTGYRRMASDSKFKFSSLFRQHGVFEGNSVCGRRTWSKR